MTRFFSIAGTGVLIVVLAAGCTGGSETNAAVEGEVPRETEASLAGVDAHRELTRISPAIPIYQGARFREDLTGRDAVMIRRRFGNEARVFTLATDDSFPQVYHYYTTYLAQFRSFPSQDTWPSGRQNWRTLEVPLNSSMQDPFIPGKTLDPNGTQVLLQIAETEAEPRTVIRYIVTPAPAAGAQVQGPAPQVAVSNDSAGQPVAR